MSTCTSDEKESITTHSEPITTQEPLGKAISSKSQCRNNFIVV